MLSKEEIAIYQKMADSNIDKILEHFNVKTNKNYYNYTGPCHIHGGDNPSAFTIYYKQENPRWVCFTHKCHLKYNGSSLGLIRGLISRELGKEAPFHKVIDFCKTKLETLLNTGTIIAPTNFSLDTNVPHYNITRQEVRSRLKIPSQFFLNKGFSPEVLDEYDVGESIKPNKRTYWRAIVPIYDEMGKYCIGCSGRSIFDECPLCHCHHDISWNCPKENIQGFYRKWKHLDFKSGSNLYNYWKLPNRVDSVILVESPGNVWRLVEAGYRNVVAMYGSRRLTRQQLKLLDKKGVAKLYLAFDNDQAGEEAFKLNASELWTKYNINKIKIPKEFNDIAEMPLNMINDILNL